MTLKSILRKATYLLPYYLARKRLDRIDYIQLMGYRLEIIPTVFHPALFFSSTQLAKFVKTLDLKGKHVLDMGTGSGIIGMCAASGGATVLGIDLNPAAVECARKNITANGLQDNMKVVASDLFDQLPEDTKFDLILWNPPFYSSRPDSVSALAWRTGEGYDVIRRFAEKSASHLNEDGSVILILSSDMKTGEVLGLFLSRNYGIIPHLSIQKLFETFTIYEIKTFKGTSS